MVERPTSSYAPLDAAHQDEKQREELEREKAAALRREQEQAAARETEAQVLSKFDKNLAPQQGQDERAQDEPSRPPSPQEKSYLHSQQDFERITREREAGIEREARRKEIEEERGSLFAEADKQYEKGQFGLAADQGNLTPEQQRAVEHDRATNQSTEQHEAEAKRENQSRDAQAEPSPQKEATDRQQEVSEKKAERVDEGKRQVGLDWYRAKREIERAQEREGGHGR